jgi:hypothetical protein
LQQGVGRRFLTGRRNGAIAFMGRGFVAAALARVVALAASPAATPSAPAPPSAPLSIVVFATASQRRLLAQARRQFGTLIQVVARLRHVLRIDGLGRIAVAAALVPLGLRALLMSVLRSAARPILAPATPPPAARATSAILAFAGCRRCLLGGFFGVSVALEAPFHIDDGPVLRLLRSGLDGRFLDREIGACMRSLACTVMVRLYRRSMSVTNGRLLLRM